MAYITEVDLAEYAPSVELESEVFAELAERASDVIDSMTFGRITRYGFDNLAAHAQEGVIKAVCAQVQMMAERGGLSAVVGDSDANKQTERVGNYSYTLAGGGAVQSIHGVPVSPFAEDYLLRAGLMYRGLRIR